MLKYKTKILKIINILTIIFIILLPYYIFGGKLFIGGDDTRLFYIYPYEWLKNISFFSWFHFSSVGLENPNQAILPLLIIFLFLKMIINSSIVIDYLAFSLPLILGFVFFQKLIQQLLSKTNSNTRLITYTGSLFYIFSPILIQNQLSIFLYSVWLIGLFPIIGYFFIRYLKTESILFIFLNIIISTIFSVSLSSIPWVLGLILPLIIGFLFGLFLFNKTEIVFFLKKSIIFLGILLLSQSFWVLPLITNLISVKNNSFIGNIFSPQFGSSFVPTVLATANGNIIFPLLNLPHRQIAFDFNWNVKSVFIDHYDRFYLLNIIFILIVFYGLFYSKKFLNSLEQKIYLVLFLAFLSSLFFYTVNIGILKPFFLFLGYIPGFVMFRNFYDKFALGYVFLYALIFTISLVIFQRSIIKKNILLMINILVLLIIYINIIPIKKIIYVPIWTTHNTYSNINLPQEYINFMNEVKSKLTSSSKILSLPLNVASYTLIKDDNSNNIFAGRSPVQLFTGINDFSGELSFPREETAKLYDYFKKRDYFNLERFLYKYNINYIFVTRNIPDDLLESYLYKKELTKYQEEMSLSQILDKKIVESENGNYVLYSTRIKNTALSSNNLIFQKINNVKYKLYIKKLKNPQQLVFHDSYHDGWRLFLVKNPSLKWCNEKRHFDKIKINIIECNQGFDFFNLSDIFRSFQKSVFDNSHTLFNNFSNKWIIDPLVVKENFSRDFYKTNQDGSYDLEMELYFVPQNHFYFGAILSIVTITGVIFFYFFRLERKISKK
ncbi:MAG: hypothetical protein KatS3mg089_0408 [Patescibacteria group bacterium]|nr:MAG: hypothetical protein KatS3mg089_0408 [Patescibacteria group bacterium]